MTPAERAKELKHVFAMKLLDVGNVIQVFECAKQCAVVCVDEILSEADKYGGYEMECEDDDGYSCSPNERKEYWLSVKEQIKLL